MLRMVFEYFGSRNMRKLFYNLFVASRQTQSNRKNVFWKTINQQNVRSFKEKIIVWGKATVLIVWSKTVFKRNFLDKMESTFKVFVKSLNFYDIEQDKKEKIQKNNTIIR